jgi:hypothetical protein
MTGMASWHGFHRQNLCAHKSAGFGGDKHFYGAVINTMEDQILYLLPRTCVISAEFGKFAVKL